MPGEGKMVVIEADVLLAAYASGYFPMADSRSGPIRWYSPDQRAIIPLDEFKFSRSLRQTLRKRLSNVRIDTSFEKVIRSCAAREETWISEEIVQSYLRLHQYGYAHSVETWRGSELVGGLYGVALGGAFFGESMFSSVPDASKVALSFLVERLRSNGFELLDTQILTPHLCRLGAIEISRERYQALLARAIVKKCKFSD